MPKQSTDELESRSAQRSKSNRATFDLLKSKPRAEKEVAITIPDADGEDNEVTMLFRAIGSQEYDKLLSKNPPNTEQKADGDSYNVNTFGPALLAKVCIEPDMSMKDWQSLWNSDDWNRGEIMHMFATAVGLCNKGLDIPLTATD